MTINVVEEVEDEVEVQPGFRFGLIPMFYALTLIATGLALGPLTVFFSAIVICAWFRVFSSSHPVLTFWHACFWVTIFAFCGGILTTRSPVFETARRVHCQNKMRLLQLAILNYESAYQYFPNATSRSSDEKLKHSWRVMIMPFMDQGSQPRFPYDFDEPWDGPNNRNLVSQMPDEFMCPENPIPGKTPYKLVVDKATAFEPGTKISADSIPDSSSNTIAIVEDVANQVNWMKPEDLTIDQALELLNNMDRSNCAHSVTEDAFGTRYGSLNVVMMDDMTYSRVINPNQAFTSSAFTINDGENEELDWSGQMINESKPQGYVALGAYLILIFVPLVSIWRRNQ